MPTAVTWRPRAGQEVAKLGQPDVDAAIIDLGVGRASTCVVDAGKDAPRRWGTGENAATGSLRGRIEAVLKRIGRIDSLIELPRW